MTGTPSSDWLAPLSADSVALGRASTAQRVADILRTRVLEGDLRPGLRLSEELIGQALGVSRNTLREAFRLLTHERLLVHEHSRGVFVRTPDTADVVDLYAARRIIEGGALARWPSADDAARERVRAAVRYQREAAEAQRWDDVATGNIAFHQAVTGLAGSARLDEEVRRLLAELRLMFHHMGDPREFHEDYVRLNREILALLEAGEVAAAGDRLAAYFGVAERHLVSRMRESGA
ncbi:GntR family transcriptional regulator [Actinokineospora auranticolor]|uniref:DNA-binding GntR family transcriptional regulator n=1 Tax=Actinokineospora auranticolor TaxID=155976 RepID=A0A2S6GI38_9PSEU|nr:GntR family transcriptional regulator [Actinokineospora auranticolor]PPK64853.1 DNA-binding GntR family transcriptional regulator [Actinokineospora auranticolor]